MAIDKYEKGKEQKRMIMERQGERMLFQIELSWQNTHK